MRSTGPTLRRRNWNARRSKVQWGHYLRARHGDEENADDEDHADGEDHADHSDSDSGSEADEEEEETKPRFFKPAVQPNAIVSAGRNLTFGPNPGSGLGVPTTLPESTLGAGEGDIEAEEEDEEEEEEEEDSDSESDDDDSSSDDDSEAEEETAIPSQGPTASTTGRAAIATSPVLAPIGGVAGDATGTGTAPTATQPGGIMSQIQPPASATRQETTESTTSTSVTVPTPDTTPASPQLTPDATRSLGGVDRIVTGTSEPTTLADSAPVLSDNGDGMETGAAAGIIIGTLAFVGILLIGGWFLYKKMRSRDPGSDSDSDSSSGLKFSPPKIFNFRSSADRSTYSWKFWDTNSSSGTRTTVAPAPILPPSGLPAANKKTNSEMVDDLMRAAYAAESGANHNDLESRAGYWDEKSQAAAPVPHPAQVNEQTYKALFGNGPNSPMPPAAPSMPFVVKPGSQGRPLTNGSNPMMMWLDATATPRQSKFGPPPSNTG